MGRTIIIALTIVFVATGAWVADLVVAQSHPADHMVAMAPLTVDVAWK